MDYKRALKAALPDLLEAGIIKFDVPLKDYCSFKIGGPADVFCTPVSNANIIAILQFCISENIPYFILGKGSNLLIPDNGLRSVVISTQNMQKLTRDKDYISAFCGVSLSELSEYAQQMGLSGLEFAHGIPGSVGGAVYMNAGAYGGEIKDVLYCSKCLVPTIDSLTSGNPVLHLKAADHHFGYRKSVFQQGKLIHLSSVFHLAPKAPDEILASMDELKEQRWEKQPMDMPSAGSVFKRPEGHFTGKLVDDCGLRGFRIGDAAVSDKHCGFIVNLGSATAAEVLQVIRHVQQTVKTRFGVSLETEIRILGDHEA